MRAFVLYIYKHVLVCVPLVSVRENAWASFEHAIVLSDEEVCIVLLSMCACGCVCVVFCLYEERF